MRVILLLCLSFFSLASEAKILFYDKRGIKIEVPYPRDAFLKFDKQVKRISEASSFAIKTTDEVTPDYSDIMLTPKFTAGSETLTVLLEDGTTTKVTIQVVPENKNVHYEDRFELRAKESQSEFENSKSAAKISEVELMKAMIRDDFVPGFQRRVIDRPVNVSQSGVTASMIRHYEGQGLQGFVFKVTNHMNLKTAKVDLKTLRLGKPNLAILSQADDLELKGKAKGDNETIVRIVAKGTARMTDVRLPVGVQKGDKEVSR